MLVGADISRPKANERELHSRTAQSRYPAGRQIAAPYELSMLGRISSVVSAKNIQPPRFAGGLGAFRRYWVTSGYIDLGYMDFYYCASFAPRLRQAVRASESGVSWQITLSQTSSAPSLRQVSSQVDIHSPSPQP